MEYNLYKFWITLLYTWDIILGINYTSINNIVTGLFFTKIAIFWLRWFDNRDPAIFEFRANSKTHTLFTATYFFLSEAILHSNACPRWTSSPVAEGCRHARSTASSRAGLLRVACCGRSLQCCGPVTPTSVQLSDSIVRHRTSDSWLASSFQQKLGVEIPCLAQEG